MKAARTLDLDRCVRLDNSKKDAQAGQRTARLLLVVSVVHIVGIDGQHGACISN